MARPRPASTSSRASATPRGGGDGGDGHGAPLPPLVVDGEHRARKCGRHFAKEIFQAPQQWKIIGTHPTDHVEIFELVQPPAHLELAASSARSVRAVRKLRGAIEDVEVVLRATHTAQLYAKLLPELYVSGGCIADYGLVKHDTNEREHTNVQFAMHHAHVWNHALDEHERAPGFDHHLFLEYSLATPLQRTQIAMRPDGSTSTVTKPVPSLLYVLRPVVVPSFSDRHAEFEPHRLAKNQLSVTYIVQQEDTDKLSLEVVLACSFNEPEQLVSVRASNTSEMWRFVVALTRLQPLVDGVRLGREETTRRTAPATHTHGTAEPLAAFQVPRRATEVPSLHSHRSNAPPRERASTRVKMKEIFGHRDRKTSSAGLESSDSEDDCWESDLQAATSGGCAVCRKRFHAFRWKKRCEVCLQGVCDHCLSTIANPSAMRKKKRVCGACLYGGTNSGFERVTGAADFAHDADRAAREVRLRARTEAPLSHRGATSQRGYATATTPDSTGTSSARSSRRYTAPEAARRRANTAASARPPPSQGPPPLPVVQPKVVQPPAPTVPTRAAPIMLTPPTPTAVTSSWASEEQSGCTNPDSELGDVDASQNPYKSNSFFDETDPSGIVSDDEFVTVNRLRRAQTVEIGDVDIKRVEKTRRHSRAAEMELPRPEPRFLPSSVRARGRSFSNDHKGLEPLDLSEFQLRLSKKKAAKGALTSASTKRATMQFRQLKTPPIKYDLDFDWLNPFPKAPLPQGTKERERIEYMATQLKLNAHTAMVYLRRDSVLEELTQTVVGSLATQWDGCSVHLIGERQVFCLAYSYQEPLPVSDEAIEIVTEDVVAREESASSYALFHQAAFFVPDLGKDDRFRAHPLHTDAHVASYLSLPIYTAAGNRSCIGTLDLWRLDPSGVSSHISQDWWAKMERVLTKVASRIEELSLAHAGHTAPTFLKSRPQKARSVGSSTDSRGSTRKDDSFEADLQDLEEEQVLRDSEIQVHDDDSDTEYELDWTTSPAEVAAPAPHTRQRRHTVADQFDTRQTSGSFLDNRSSTSSSLDLESTIESLLNQAKRTSQYVREHGHTHA